MIDFKQLEKDLNKELDSLGRVEKKDGLTTYRNIVQEGYLSDFTTEWWTEEDWVRHRELVAELEKEGRYGKPYICEITLKDCPLFDNRTFYPEKKPMESYRFEMLDLSK